MGGAAEGNGLVEWSGGGVLTFKRIRTCFVTLRSLFLGYILDHASRQRTETELGEQKKTSLVYLA